MGRTKASRAPVWLESLGEWTWPGQGGTAAVEALPPPWVPAFPPRREAVAPALRPGVPAPVRRRRARIRGAITGVLLLALLAVSTTLALHRQVAVERFLGLPVAHAVPRPARAAAGTISTPAPAQPLPVVKNLSTDAAGSSIDEANFASVALPGHTGSFLAYLPAGYASTYAHYPVIYMLTGDDQSDEAFLQIGLQEQLDRLIASHAIPPLIAVMIQGGPGANLWRNQGALRYESYILEVQELVDRTLPTIPARDERAIVGDSMGGYGSMNVALSNPYRFGTVESWLSFFNGLGPTLAADRPVIQRLGLHAFIYGGAQDHVANPGEDAPFAASLRAAGADAHSAIYPGEHDLQTLQEHLTSMLVFAGRSLRAGQSATARRAPAGAAGPNSAG